MDLLVAFALLCTLYSVQYKRKFPTDALALWGRNVLYGLNTWAQF